MVTDGGERKGLLFWVIPGLPADSFLGKNVVTTMIAQKMQENRVWVSLTARRRELGLAARRLARFSSRSGTTGYS